MYGNMVNMIYLDIHDTFRDAFTSDDIYDTFDFDDIYMIHLLLMIYMIHEDKYIIIYYIIIPRKLVSIPLPS